jgi:hypothetical protein
VNLPVSVIAVAMTAVVITESSDPAARRVDGPGMITFTAAAGCLIYALIRGRLVIAGHAGAAGRGGRRARVVRGGRA